MKYLKSRDEKWSALHSIIMWVFGVFILISFSYLSILNEWLARITVEIIIGLTPFLVVLTFFNKNFDELGLLKPSLKETITGVGFGLLGVLSGFLAFNLEVLILGGYPIGYHEFQLKFTPLQLTDLVIWIAFSVIIVAPCEEIFSRGFIQKGLQNSGGVLFGLIASSILFGLIHIEPFRILPNTVQGFTLGAAYIRSKYKTSVSIISHATLNTSIFILMFFLPYYFGL